ncbi:hypothetical protein Tco_0552903 [Tanacetum coccineum]
MNELVNDGIKLSNLKINTGFINGLPKKWLSFYQSLRNTNHVKEYKLASLFGKLKYEDNLIDSIYESEKKKSLVNATPLSTAFFLTSIVQDFQDSPEDEEIQEVTSVPLYSSPFQKSQTTIFSPSQQKTKLRPNKDFEAKYNKVKAKLDLLSSSTSSKSSMVNNKGHVAEAYEWDEEDVSSDDNDMTEVKVLMALADDENVAVGKESARNGEWVKISMKKVHTLLDMEDNDERKSFLDYLCIDLNYHANTKILKENKNLRIELKKLTTITETYLNTSNKVNQCIIEQIPSQKKRILGLDQLTKDPSSYGQIDLVFVKSSTEDIKVSILGVERPWLSKAEGFTLPNHDTGRILPAESQVKITDPLVT